MCNSVPAVCRNYNKKGQTEAGKKEYLDLNSSLVVESGLITSEEDAAWLTVCTVCGGGWWQLENICTHITYVLCV